MCRQFGCHLDAVNGNGQTIADLAKSDEMKSLLWSHESNSVSLKCLASRAIIRHGVEYKESRVPYLVKYIQFHDPHREYSKCL